MVRKHLGCVVGVMLGISAIAPVGIRAHMEAATRWVERHIAAAHYAQGDAAISFANQILEDPTPETRFEDRLSRKGFAKGLAEDLWNVWQPSQARTVGTLEYLWKGKPNPLPDLPRYSVSVDGHTGVIRLTPVDTREVWHVSGRPIYNAFVHGVSVDDHTGEIRLTPEADYRGGWHLYGRPNYCASVHSVSVDDCIKDIKEMQLPPPLYLQAMTLLLGRHSYGTFLDDLTGEIRLIPRSHPQETHLLPSLPGYDVSVDDPTGEIRLTPLRSPQETHPLPTSEPTRVPLSPGQIPIIPIDPAESIATFTPPAQVTPGPPTAEPTIIEPILPTEQYESAEFLEFQTYLEQLYEDIKALLADPERMASVVMGSLIFATGRDIGKSLLKYMMGRIKERALPPKIGQSEAASALLARLASRLQLLDEFFATTAQARRDVISLATGIPFDELLPILEAGPFDHARNCFWKLMEQVDSPQPVTT